MLGNILLIGFFDTLYSLKDDFKLSPGWYMSSSKVYH